MQEQPDGPAAVRLDHVRPAAPRAEEPRPAEVAPPEKNKIERFPNPAVALAKRGSRSFSFECGIITIMRLEKLVIRGFKSFVDEVTFDFKKNFTAIVGPNGSGKSNISDAIRWVLGEQRLKALRGKLAHDVIFSGSEKLTRLGMASVELHLDNSDHRLPLAYRDVVISRKVFRDGESEYRINKAEVRLQDLLILLAQGKFGQKSFAVIGQGMITHFLNSSAQERKLFFDEATGVKEFQIKRDHAINKLIRTEEHLQQADVLLGEIAPRLHSLTRQVKRFERREKIAEELRESQIAYYGGVWKELMHDLVAERAAHAHKAEAITGREKKYAAVQREVDAIAQESSQRERYEKLQHEHNILLEQKSRLLKEEAVMKGKLELEHERQGQLRLVWLQRKKDELAHDEVQYTSELRLLQEEMRRLKREADTHEEQLRVLHEELHAEEKELLNMRTNFDQQAHAVPMPEIRAQLTKLFDEQEQFLRDLLATRSLEEFKIVQARAKHFTKNFAAFLDQLNSESEEEKEIAQRAQLAMQEFGKRIEDKRGERANVQRAANDLRVRFETTKAKSAMLVHTLQRVSDNRKTVAHEEHALEKQGGNGTNSERARYAAALEEFGKKLAACDRDLEKVRKTLDEFHEIEERKKTHLVALQKQLHNFQREISALQHDANTIEIQIARRETHQEDLAQEIRRVAEPAILHAIFQFAGTPGAHEELRRRCETLQRQIAIIGAVDEETRTEYQQTKERHDFLEEQTRDLAKSLTSLEKIIDELDTTIHTQFQKNFKKINSEFEKYFRLLFGGGNARLTMMTEQEQKEEAPLPADGAIIETGETGAAEALANRPSPGRDFLGKKKKREKIVAGIEMMASPPGKKVVHVTALSGGEKSLAALALLCAIIAHNPSPFVVLDEVEAALDEENSEKVAAILHKLAEKTQIIIITHNRATMRAVDILYGVTMGSDGKSHILSVALKEAEALAKKSA